MKLQKSAVLFVAALLLISFASIGMAQDAGKININTASVEELAKLNRIGPSYARRIVEYREQNGPFERPQDIMKVKGIGEKTWEANIDLIVVQ